MLYKKTTNFRLFMQLEMILQDTYEHKKV